jgi:hypothetical protein
VPPLGDLGWRGEAGHDDPAVAALRAELAASAGIPGIEADCVVRPGEPGYGALAAEIFQREGFVVVKGVLDAQRLATIRRGVDQVVRLMLAEDPRREGNRGSHRYTFFTAPAHFGYQAEWAALIDPPALTPVLTELLGPGYLCATGTSGGDFALPGALSYQALHSDGMAPPDAGRALPIEQMGLAVIYPMEVVQSPSHTVGHNGFNGATRYIRGSHRWQGAIPGLGDEPRWMRLSTLQPADAGDAIVRDLRSWHGATPNLSRHVRAIPDVKFCAAAAAPPHLGGRGFPAGFPSAAYGFERAMPHGVWQQLTPHGQHVCRGIVAAPGAETNVDWEPQRRPVYERATPAGIVPTLPRI